MTDCATCGPTAACECEAPRSISLRCPECSRALCVDCMAAVLIALALELRRAPTLRPEAVDRMLRATRSALAAIVLGEGGTYGLLLATRPRTGYEIEAITGWRALLVCLGVASEDARATVQLALRPDAIPLRRRGLDS